jgi:hypothetical protein
MDDTSGRHLALRPHGTVFLDVDRFELAQRVAQVFATSKLAPEALRRSMPDCLIALDIAERMGESPLMVMQQIFFVHGKAGWSSQFMIARAKQSGIFDGPLRWKTEGEGDGLKVTCFADLARVTEDRRVEVTVSMAMAKADGWTQNEKYRSIPEQMLRWRAAGWLVKLYCPQVMMGMSSIDELIDTRGRDDPLDITPRPELHQYTGPLTPPAAEVDAGGTPAAASPTPPGKRTRTRKPAAPSLVEAEAERTEQSDIPGERLGLGPGETVTAVTGLGLGDDDDRDPPEPDPEDEPPEDTEPPIGDPPEDGELVVETSYNVFVPGGEALQSWFAPAKAKLVEMLDAGCTAADFRRFRAENEKPLREMQEGYNFWFKSLAELMQRGERR